MSVAVDDDYTRVVTSIVGYPGIPNVVLLVSGCPGRTKEMWG
jgi:hypothetical protein